MLREKDVVVADEKDLATLMNNYFVNVTADLDLKWDSEKFYDTPASVFNIKKKFQDHQSILKIKKAFNVTDLFSFHETTEDEILKEISKLDGSKATPVGDIPAEMLKSANDVHVSLLTKIIDSSIRNGCFPDELKAAEVTPIFKKNDDLDKKKLYACQCFVSCVKDHWKGHVNPNWKFHGRQVIKIAYKFQEKPYHSTLFS